MNASDLKPFSVPFSFNFTNENLSTIVDLGCVYLCNLWKEYGQGKLVEGHIVIDKKTLSPILLEGKQVVFDKIINDNEKSPQQNYFMLRYGNERDAVIYSPNGNPIELKKFKKPRESNVMCGKNIVMFNPSWSETYYSFNPTTGEALNILAMLSKVEKDLQGRGISFKEIDGDVQIRIHKTNHFMKYESEVTARYVISDGIELEEVVMT